MAADGNNDYSTYSGIVNYYSLDGNLESTVAYLLGTPNCQPDQPCPDCPTTPQGPGGGTGGNGGGIPGGGAGGGGGTGGGSGGGTTGDGGGDSPGGGNSLCPFCATRDQDTGACKQWIMVACTSGFIARQIKNCDVIYEGGGGGVVIVTAQDPCTKTKALVANNLLQNLVTQLKSNSTTGTGEMGFKVNKAGTPTVMIPGGDHSVNFGDKTGYAGGYHNHTNTGIPMNSPPDIDQLLGFARAQGNYGDPTLAFVGMVAPNGMHYIIWFTGTYQDALTNFSQDDLDKLSDKYQTRYGIHKPITGDMNNDAIERFFFKALKDMGLDGKVNLQRIESDGTVKTIIKNTDGTTTAIPCP